MPTGWCDFNRLKLWSVCLWSDEITQCEINISLVLDHCVNPSVYLLSLPGHSQPLLTEWNSAFPFNYFSSVQPTARDWPYYPTSHRKCLLVTLEVCSIYTNNYNHILHFNKESTDARGFFLFVGCVCMFAFVCVRILDILDYDSMTNKVSNKEKATHYHGLLLCNGHNVFFAQIVPVFPVKHLTF